MERTQKGGLKKYGDYMEVTFSGDEVYETCVDKVIAICRVSPFLPVANQQNTFVFHLQGKL